MNNLRELLASQGYICDEKFARKVRAALATKPVAGAFLRGAAGTGKTALPAALAKGTGRTLLFQQCFPGSREDDFLFKIMPDTCAASGVSMHDGVIVQAIKKSHSASVILVLDEWDKTRPSADAFLLDFLQSGRVATAKETLIANLSNLVVFITMNDEREISEPLLRRLPMIDFPFLSPSRVREALMLTHAGHPQLEAAVSLYAKTVAAGMPKPATIQELRQLLDAITNLGNEADWDELVYQFVTKTPEQHSMLAQVQYESVSVERESSRPTLDVSAFEQEEPFNENENKEKEIKPSLPKARVYQSLSVPDVIPHIENASGVLRLTESAYNAAVSLSECATDSATSLDAAEVGGDIIVIKKTIDITEAYQSAEVLWGNEGEVVFHTHHATIDDVKGLQKRGLVITKFSKHEVLGKCGEAITLRWTPEICEVVCDLRQRTTFEEIFGRVGSKEDMSKTWIGVYCSDFEYSFSKELSRCGIMYQRKYKHQEAPTSVYRRRRVSLEDEVVSLTPAQNAIIRVEKLGFEEPREGNRARVVAKILLAFFKDKRYRNQGKIADELQFNLHLFGEKLCQTHSFKDDFQQEVEVRVFSAKEFRAETYADAIHIARTAAHEEIVKLIKAIRTRRFAIERAERSIEQC